MKITIAGDLGSGKSAVARELCHKMGYTYLSTGQIHREIASEYKVNALELNKLAAKDKTIDDRIDSRLMECNDKSENYVIDSRMGWHFVKDTFKVYLQVDPEVGLERIFLAKDRLNEPIYLDKDSAKKKLLERKQIENKRFKLKYNVDCSDLDNYDVVVNSTFVTQTEVADLIIYLKDIWEKRQPCVKFWLSPRLLYPTEHVQSLASDNAKELMDIVKHGYLNLNDPIQSVVCNGFYYIWNGHKRTSAALFSSTNIVPVEVIAKDDEPIHKGHSVRLFVSGINKSLFYDWEAIHKFHFIRYPSEVQ